MNVSKLPARDRPYEVVVRKDANSRTFEADVEVHDVSHELLGRTFTRKVGRAGYTREEVIRKAISEAIVHVCSAIQHGERDPLKPIAFVVKDKP